MYQLSRRLVNISFVYDATAEFLENLFNFFRRGTVFEDDASFCQCIATIRVVALFTVSIRADGKKEVEEFRNATLGEHLRTDGPKI